MCEPKAYLALFLGLACACEASPASPPNAPATVVPVASASSAALAVEPAPPSNAQSNDADASAQQAPDDLSNHTNPNDPGGRFGGAPPPSGPATAPFDRGRAAFALGSVRVQPCASMSKSGPSGVGRVKITFAGSTGTPRAVSVDAPYAGTAVGDCVISQFRSVSVPPFSGADVTVAKSFTIQ